MIFKVKLKGKDIRHSNEFEKIIMDKNDSQLNFLLKPGIHGNQEKKTQRKRFKQFRYCTSHISHWL